MREDDNISGPVFVIIVGCAALIIGCCENQPDRIADKRAAEMRATENKELAEWLRAKQLREMREDKAKLEGH